MRFRQALWQLSDDWPRYEIEDDLAWIQLEPVSSGLQDSLFCCPESGGGERSFGGWKTKELTYFSGIEVLAGEFSPLVEIGNLADVYANPAIGCGAHGHPRPVMSDAEVDPLVVIFCEDWLTFSCGHYVGYWNIMVFTESFSEDGPA